MSPAVCARPMKLQLDAALAEIERHALLEGDGRPGEAGDGLGGAEQAREAAIFGIPVLLAALGDHGAAVLRADHLLRLVGRGAEHAHGVIVREHHVLDGLVGDLPHAVDDELGHHRRRLRVDDDDAVVADDHAAVGIALGREGVEVAADLGEGDLLLGHVAGGGKVLGHVSVSPSVSSRALCPGSSSNIAGEAARWIPVTSTGMTRRASSLGIAHDLLLDGAEDGAAGSSSISMRTRSPNFRNGVVGLPSRIVSTVRTSARQV